MKKIITLLLALGTTSLLSAGNCPGGCCPNAMGGSYNQGPTGRTDGMMYGNRPMGRQDGMMYGNRPMGRSDGMMYGNRPMGRSDGMMYGNQGPVGRQDGMMYGNQGPMDRENYNQRLDGQPFYPTQGEPNLYDSPKMNPSMNRYYQGGDRRAFRQGGEGFYRNEMRQGSYRASQMDNQPMQYDNQPMQYDNQTRFQRGTQMDSQYTNPSDNINQRFQYTPSNR